MAYTVQKLGEIAGVSVRTLHYYDEIGLLKPSYIKNNGYRYYEEAELLKLQQIMFFRELDFTLEEIKRILHSPDYDALQALQDQKKILETEIKRLHGLLTTIDKTVKKMNGKVKMDDKELYGSFTKEEVEQYRKEARQKYGNYHDKTEKMSREELNKLLEDGNVITMKIVELIKNDHKPSDPEIQEQVEKHYVYMNKFWDCDYDAYKGLGHLYVDDERFTKNIDKAHEGLSAFLREAMAFYSDNHTK